MTVVDLQECMLTWESASPDETERMGEILGRLLRWGDVVALFGELGSGKTVLVRGIAAGLGCRREDVHSPSFTLVNEYECPRGSQGAAGPGGHRCMAHVDLYRLHSEDEIPGIGWDEYLDSRHVVAVEWADRAEGWLSGDHLRVRLEVVGAQRRRLRIQPTGRRSVQVALGWVQAAGIAATAC